jgi:hypothetical protein
MRYFLLFWMLLFVFLGTESHAQFYSAGQPPGSMRWNQIRTENFQVIFPQGYEEQGKYIADILEYAYEHASSSLEHRPRKISVIVHTHTVISNGFISWAPRRMELFANPPANNQPHDWMEYLVLHEFRHVVQLDKLNQGITKILGYVFGEQAVGAVMGLFLPIWFVEGDAVVMETAMTHAGRGRAPSFEQGLRAQVLNRGIYSYEKAVYGSYKDYVPNHYELGYQLVAAGRLTNDPNVWAGVVDKVARRPFIRPFSAGMKQHMGLSMDRHYLNTLNMLDSAWSHQRQLKRYTPVSVISPQNRLYTNYTQGNWLNDTTLIALKTGMKDIPRIVKVSLSGEEQVLFAPGWFFPNAFDYAAGKLVWNEQRPDARWEHRNWSEIMIYDFDSNIRRRLTHKGRYFSPTLSPDGRRVAAVLTTALSEYYMVILDAETGDELFRQSYAGNHYMQSLAWHSEGERIAVSVLDAAGKRIDIINTSSGEVTNVYPSTYYDFASLRFVGDDLVLNGTWSGIDNIYLLNSDTGEMSQLVSSEFGAINPSFSPDGSLLVYSDYSSNGYQLSVVASEDLFNLPLDFVADHSPAFHKVLEAQESALVTRANILSSTHEVKKYSRLANLFHLHSWAPAFVDAGNREINPGASLLFQNKLSTSFATVGYLWDVNDETGKFSLNYSYQGWYPIINFATETGTRRVYYRNRNEIQNFIVSENIYRMSVSVPLNFRRHEYIYGFVPSIGAGINHAYANKHTPDTIFSDNSGFTFEENRVYRQDYRVFAYRQIRRVARDIYPRWGQSADISYRHTPFLVEQGSLLAMRGIGYFPGLLPHHGLRLSAAWQQRTLLSRPNTVNYNFGNLVMYPRGFTGLSHQQIAAFSADYALPVLYPDFNIRYLLYLMRIRGHVFADHAQARLFPDQANPAANPNQKFSSYGFGITGDMHLFRFIAPLALGVEVAFPVGNPVYYRFILGMGL